MDDTREAHCEEKGHRVKMKIGIASSDVFEAMLDPDLADAIAELPGKRMAPFRYFLVEITTSKRFYVGDGPHVVLARVAVDGSVSRVIATGREIVVAALRAARDDCDVELRH